jgi:para-nitrobenzyl esterase
MTLASSALTSLATLPAPAIAEVASAAHYSVNTTLAGKLIDDPASAAILQKLAPTVWANDLFKTAGRDLTLKAIQQYEPEALSDANLAKIQAELDKIPAKQ